MSGLSGKNLEFAVPTEHGHQEYFYTPCVDDMSCYGQEEKAMAVDIQIIMTIGRLTQFSRTNGLKFLSISIGD